MTNYIYIQVKKKKNEIQQVWQLRYKARFGNIEGIWKSLKLIIEMVPYSVTSHIKLIVVGLSKKIKINRCGLSKKINRCGDAFNCEKVSRHHKRFS